MALEDIVEKITECDMAGAEAEADYWSDLKHAKRVHNNANPNYGQDLNSFDAVGIIKQATDKKDRYYIYQINNGNLNNNSDFVFKSSRAMAELAIAMDVDSPISSVLQQENAYFDATHTCVHGFKSLGLWMYHPSMRKILRLASMDIRSENAKDIATFFTLFNEILQIESSNPEYKFNPRAFMCDEGSANYRAIQLVYGDDFMKERVVGCQWHFKNDTIRKARQVGPDMRDLFTKLCKNLCTVTTVAKYKIIKSQLDEIAKVYPEITSWIDWWNECCKHIFGPFRGGGLPGVNLSEQGNAAWRSSTMRLVHAAKYDVASMILQNKKLFKFNWNMEKSDGKGPSQGMRISRDRGDQCKIGEDFVDILSDEEALEDEANEGENPTWFLPKGKTRHRPPVTKFTFHPHVKRGTTDPHKMKPRNGKKRKKADDTEPKTNGYEENKTKSSNSVDDFNIRRKLQLKLGEADEIMSSLSHTGSQIPEELRHNPPLIVITDGTSIRICNGCDKAITPEHKIYPNNMVFCRKKVVGFYNRILNKYIHKLNNVHFHLDMRCLHKKDLSVQMRQIFMYDEVFAELSREQLKVLNDKGFLKYVIENINK